MVQNKDQMGFYGFLTITKLKDGKVLWKSEPMKNKVVTGSGGYGRNLIIRQLAGDTALPLEIDNVSIGDGTTPPADGDTDLESPLVEDVPVSNSTGANNVLTVDVFMSDSTLPDDTYSEFGLFCGGQLFARILISPSYTKATGEDTIFTYTLTATG